MLRCALLLLLAAPLQASLVDAYRQRDYDAVLHDFASIANPTSQERALYAAAQTNRSLEAARRIAAALMQSAPDDAWSWFAATTVALADEERARALETSARMLALAGNDPDEVLVRTRVQALIVAGRAAEARALLASRTQTPAVRAMRAFALLYDAREDAADEALKLFAAIRAEDPAQVDAYVEPAQWLLNKRRYAEAYALAKEAAERSVATRTHALFWRAAASLPEHVGEIESDMRALVAQRDWPAVWLAIAQQYERQRRPERAAEWIARILRDAPHSAEAEMAQGLRYSAFAQQHRQAMQSDAGVRREGIRLLREILAYRVDDATIDRSNSVRALLSLLKLEKDVDADELVSLTRELVPLAPILPFAVVDAANELADRGMRLEDAEEAARAAVDGIERYLANPGEDPAYITEVGPKLRAVARDALGWVLLRKGEPDRARNQLFAALELNPESPLLRYHLGRWYEARGDGARAAAQYRAGLALAGHGINPNDNALRELYRKEHGSLRGYDAYARSGAAGESQSRRARVLASRISAPKSAAPFKLATLDGKPLALESLRGKVVVINFWGIWCSWCVKEMPEFQKLAAKYASDPRVAVLTINNDNDPPQVRKWMAAHKYDFRVLLDDGYAGKHIGGFPTTWFVDRDGRLAFVQSGWSARLVEEFTWRIEALK
ncbi:MAG TPA: redoxin domain-containing protein [Thermoanaerobaculia bacterium]|jgi:thiol-disulfide isomerase/thioredoxin